MTVSCDMKLMMIKQFDSESSDNLLTVTLNRHEKSDCLEHNHTAEYLDTIKINSDVRLIAGQEVSKGYTPAVVNRNMQGVKWSSNFDALKNAGGINMNLMTVHNAGSGFKRINPDVRIMGANEEWTSQMNECFDALQSQGEEVLFSKIEALRVVDKNYSYGIVFAKRSEWKFSTFNHLNHM